MLTRAYREQLSFERRIGAVLAVGAVSTAAYGHWLLRVLQGPLVAGTVGLGAAALALVYATSSLLRARPAPLYPLFDRAVVRDGALADAPRAARNQALTEAGAELDALAQRLGVEPLSAFVHVEGLRPGIARHAPARALGTLEALLGALPSSGLPDAVREGLAELRLDLLAAREAGALFCLRPTPLWSSAAGRHLRLHLGTVASA